MSTNFKLSGKHSFTNALLKQFCKTETVDSEQCFNIFDEIVLWVMDFFELRLFITFLRDCTLSM